jgi:hypothetical protein
MFILGWFMADVSFAYLDDVEYGSWENRVLSGFHFLGVVLMVQGLLEACFLAEKEIKRCKSDFSEEM